MVYPCSLLCLQLAYAASRVPSRKDSYSKRSAARKPPVGLTNLLDVRNMTHDSSHGCHPVMIVVCLPNSPFLTYIVVHRSACRRPVTLTRQLCQIPTFTLSSYLVAFGCAWSEIQARRKQPLRCSRHWMSASQQAEWQTLRTPVMTDRTGNRKSTSKIAAMFRRAV